MNNPEKIRLALRGLDSVSDRARAEVVFIIRRELEPLVKRAGKSLLLTVGRSPGDLMLEFASTTPPDPPCKFTILGADADRIVYVQSHRNLRVCGKRDPITKQRDMRRILTTDVLLGRALANTGLHELGHFIADLEHNKSIINYMYTGDLPVGQRNILTRRENFAGVQTFTEEQKQKIVAQIKDQKWLGDITIEERAP